MKHVIEALLDLEARAMRAAKARFVTDGRPSGRLLNEQQLAAHGLAYLATETMAERPVASSVRR